jgi:L-seryl-tRNA(Ser) seleniumtransferase
LVLYSGDKLLGGPQAGIIAGRKELVAKVRRHPLFRALRVDKLTIAALQVTLRAYLRADWNGIPSQRMIRTALEEISVRTKQFVEALTARVPRAEADFEIVDGTSLVGGGSTPAQSLPTRVLRIRSQRYSATQLEARLRAGRAGTPVIARIEEDRVTVDLRTVFPGQEGALADSLLAALE